MEDQLITSEQIQAIANGLPKLLQSYTPMAIENTYNGITTMDNAINCGARSFLSIANGNDGVGDKSVIALLKLHLLSLTIFLKQKNGLTTDEIDFLAKSIYEEHGDFINFADMNVIFRNAKLGRYGNLYESLTCAKIMQWFDDYVGRKVVAIESIRIEEKDRIGGVDKLSDNQLVRDLGYRLLEGKIMVDKDGKPLPPKKSDLERMEEVRKKNEDADSKKKVQIDSNDYLKFERRRRYECICMKPDSIRTQNEKAFIQQYEAVYNSKK